MFIKNSCHLTPSRTKLPLQAKNTEQSVSLKLAPKITFVLSFETSVCYLTFIYYDNIQNHPAEQSFHDIKLFNKTSYLLFRVNIVII